MVQIIINEDELLTTIRKRVSGNGQISIGKEYAGMEITAYIVPFQSSKTPIVRQ